MAVMNRNRDPFVCFFVLFSMVLWSETFHVNALMTASRRYPQSFRYSLSVRCSLRNRRKQKRDEIMDNERQRDAIKTEEKALQGLSKPSNEEAEAYPVPLHLATERITHPHLQFHGFDTLFHGSNLAELFDTNATFREAIRIAAREDFFVNDDTLPPCANYALKDPRSTLMSSWRRINDYHHLTQVFALYHVTNGVMSSTTTATTTTTTSSANTTSSINGPWLNGSHFMTTLSSLCGTSPHVFGSWIDIVGVKNKHVHHSWHQDSGLEQRTVMVGFPPTDRYHGIGVFSHAVRLSHRLGTPINTNEPRLWSQTFTLLSTEKITIDGVVDSSSSACSSASSDVSSDASNTAGRSSSRGGNSEGTNHGDNTTSNKITSTSDTSVIDEKYIIRPLYQRGREVMVYDDRDIFHSAPDYTHRQSIWRFM